MSDKARVLAALRAGDVTPTDFLPPNVTGKPIQRVAARINDLRRDGYGIETVQVRPTAVYRLTSSPLPQTARRDIEQAANDGDRAVGDPVAVPQIHSGIDLEADGLGPDIPACGPAWSDSKNPYAASMPDVPLGAGRFSVYADPDDDGDESWITEEAA